MDYLIFLQTPNCFLIGYVFHQIVILPWTHHNFHCRTTHLLAIYIKSSTCYYSISHYTQRILYYKQFDYLIHLHYLLHSYNDKYHGIQSDLLY